MNKLMNRVCFGLGVFVLSMSAQEASAVQYGKLIYSRPHIEKVRDGKGKEVDLKVPGYYVKIVGYQEEKRAVDYAIRIRLEAEDACIFEPDLMIIVKKDDFAQWEKSVADGKNVDISECKKSHVQKIVYEHADRYWKKETTTSDFKNTQSTYCSKVDSSKINYDKAAEYQFKSLSRQLNRWPWGADGVVVFTEIDESTFDKIRTPLKGVK